MTDLSKAAMLDVLERLRLVMVCDCHEVGRSYDDCRHTSNLDLVFNPELYSLWFDYRDCISQTGGRHTRESERALHRLDCASDLLRMDCPPREQ